MHTGLKSVSPTQPESCQGNWQDSEQDSLFLAISALLFCFYFCIITYNSYPLIVLIFLFPITSFTPKSADGF